MTKRKRAASDTLSVTMNSSASTPLESFSNELLLDIFEYLDAYELCQAFYGLNDRINTLLQMAQLHILHHASKKDETIWNTLVSFVNPSQIRRISSYDGTEIDQRILSVVNENLRAICLHAMTVKDTEEIFQQIPTNNRIQCVSINNEGMYNDQASGSIFDLLLVDQAHRFVSLVQLSISSNWVNFPAVSSTFPQLRRLSTENTYYCTNMVEFLQNKTPNLRSVKLNTIFHPVLPSSSIFNHLQELHMNVRDDPISLKDILSRSPSLRRLCLHCQCRGRNPVIDGTQCQKLIEQYLPHLKQLTIHFNPAADEDFLETFYKNEYWLTKKIKAKRTIGKASSRYPLVNTIYFGKEWHFDYFDHLKFE